MKKTITLIAATMLFMACSHKVTNSTTATAAVDPKALFNKDIQPILSAKCTPCHDPSKGGRKAPLVTYQDAAKYIDDMIYRVELKPEDPKHMPFMGKKEALTAAEIESLKAWKSLQVK